MAIYHLSIKPISRSTGRSAVAAAAYRAGVALVNERTGCLHDFTKKVGVVASDIILPSGAPAWAADRGALWSAAELAEKRVNAKTAREFEVALPSELSVAQRRQLAHDFARELVNRHGVAADVAIHLPSRRDSINHHAHILLTTRRIGPEGLTEKTRELDDKKTGSELTKEWRARWAELCNKHLHKFGHESQIDHRSHAERGLLEEPTTHLGPRASEIERHGVKTELGNRNRARQNKNKLIRDNADELQKLRSIEQRAQVITRELIDLRNNIGPKPRSWTTPLLESARSVFSIAKAAFKKLIHWHHFNKEIDEWRKSHPLRATLRLGAAELLELEHKKAELGDVDHDAEDKLRSARAVLNYAEQQARKEWAKKNEADKLKFNRLLSERNRIENTDYSPKNETVANKENMRPIVLPATLNEEDKIKQRPDWKPLRRAKRGYSFGAVNNISPSISNNFNPQ